MLTVMEREHPVIVSVLDLDQSSLTECWTPDTDTILPMKRRTTSAGERSITLPSGMQLLEEWSESIT